MAGLADLRGGACDQPLRPAQHDHLGSLWLLPPLLIGHFIGQPIGREFTEYIVYGRVRTAERGGGASRRKPAPREGRGARTVHEDELRIKGARRWRWDDFVAYYNTSKNKEAALRDMEHDLNVARKLGDECLATEIKRALDYIKGGRIGAPAAQKTPAAQPTAQQELDARSRRERLFEEIASLRIFDNVVGLREAKEAIAWKFLIPLLFPEKAPGVEPRLGVLLYGPPGVGKSELARSLANVCERLGIQVLTLRPTDVDKPLVGLGEKSVARTFEAARRMPTVVIIDEALTVIGRRQPSESRVHQGPFETFLQELDSAMSDRSMRILIVACTNRPDLLDDAALRPGRIGEKIYVPPPGREERKALFRLFLSGKPVSGEIDYDRLADLTEASQVGYYSGDDIRAICQDALVEAYKRGREAITMEDLEAAASKRAPSISHTFLSFYEEFKYASTG
ncbi:MAG: ATP-binding protein, partial [Nitrososphaerota archaeon]